MRSPSTDIVVVRIHKRATQQFHLFHFILSFYISDARTPNPHIRRLICTYIYLHNKYMASKAWVSFRCRGDAWRPAALFFVLGNDAQHYTHRSRESILNWLIEMHFFFCSFVSFRLRLERLIVGTNNYCVCVCAWEFHLFVIHFVSCNSILKIENPKKIGESKKSCAFTSNLSTRTIFWHRRVHHKFLLYIQRKFHFAAVAVVM